MEATNRTTIFGRLIQSGEDQQRQGTLFLRVLWLPAGSMLTKTIRI